MIARILVLATSLCAGLTASGQDGLSWADVDKSLAINSIDVQLVINGALRRPVGNFDVDLNDDGSVDAIDVQLIINIVLGITDIPISLRGSVFDGETGEPIACAAVVLTSDEFPGVTFVTVTDLLGQYELRDLPSAEYLIEVQSQRFVRDSVVAFLPTSTLTAFGLDARPVETVIQGSVNDEDGDGPLVGARVEARVDSALVDLTYTCADGTYELAIPTASKGGNAIDVEVTVTSPNYEDEMVMVAAVPGEAQAAEIVLEKSSVFPASAAGFVASRSNMMGIVGARITINGPVNTSADVNPDGTYIFPALLDGRYTYRVSAPGFFPISGSFIADGGEIVMLDFTLTPIPTETLTSTDLDRDGATTAIDIQLIINAVLGLASPTNADQDSNGVLNARDIQLVINGTT